MFDLFNWFAIIMYIKKKKYEKKTIFSFIQISTTVDYKNRKHAPKIKENF